MRGTRSVIRTKECNTYSPGGVFRAWHTLQRHKSAGEYGCVREQHIGELCRSGSPRVGELLCIHMYAHM